MKSWVWNGAKSYSHTSFADSSTAMQNLQEKKKEHIHNKREKRHRSERQV